MPNRVTDSGSSFRNSQQINYHRARLEALQEQLSTGKRINRASDDPVGYQDSLNLRTSQTEVEQFKRSAGVADQVLSATDDALGQYESNLDRLRSLASRAVSNLTTQEQKNSVAVEFDALRERILNTANTKNGGEFLFGGIRQNEAPFDAATGAPAATAANARFMQLEPGANAVAIGITASEVFGDQNGTILDDLKNAAAALRGTGDAVADAATLQKTVGRLQTYQDLAGVAHAKIGASMRNVELINDKLGSDSLAFETRIGAIENADFAGTAVALTDSQRAFEASLQIVARGRRNLLDFLG